ncbi:response regulator FixJ [Terrarubrum flagellatum]|uniref:response regulator FixJ n=1 Tax=Terrirubrum flagellatum TaxID=2895980 RepID=UPI003144EE8D
MGPTVFIIDDDDAVRESLSFLLETEKLPTRAFESAAAFLDAAGSATQGCVITDIRMPGMDGLQLVRELKGRGSPLPIIVITGHADVPLAIQAMKAGVSDFIEKPFESDVIIQSVRAALERASIAHGKDELRADAQARLTSLSSREREVLGFLVQGFSNKHIALKLQISPRTVEIHRANVMHKTQSASLSELVRLAIMVEAA